MDGKETTLRERAKRVSLWNQLLSLIPFIAIDNIDIISLAQ
jgi:hypothetical protein